MHKSSDQPIPRVLYVMQIPQELWLLEGSLGRSVWMLLFFFLGRAVHVYKMDDYWARRGRGCNFLPENYSSSEPFSH